MTDTTDITDNNNPDGLNTYMLLIKQDSEYEGSNTWWLKGEYQARDAREAVEIAHTDTYLTPRRGGHTDHKSRVAVTGPGLTWQEFTVTLKALPAEIVSIEPQPYQRDES